MTTCSTYVPYTQEELQDKIKEVMDKIAEYSGLSEYERMKNGQDEYESGDILSNLQKELALYQRYLKLRKIQDGDCSVPRKFRQGFYGCPQSR